jgi:hypothetical protein
VSRCFTLEWWRDTPSVLSRSASGLRVTRTQRSAKSDVPTGAALRFSSPIYAALLVCLASACTPARQHVVLPFLPDPSASEDDRARAYERMSPKEIHRTYPVTWLGGRAHEASYRMTDYIVLGNGMRVDYPEDLLPLVPADSATARAIEAEAEARSSHPIWFATGSTGMVLSGGALAFALVSPRDSTEQTVGWIAAAGSAVVGLVGYFVASKVREHADHEQSAAFGTYDQSLRRRLGFEGKPPKPGELPPPVNPVELEAPRPTDAPFRAALTERR